MSVRASGNRDPIDEELAAIEARAIRVMARVMQSYRLEGDALLHAVRGLRSFVHGFATLEAAGGFGLPLNLDAVFKFWFKCSPAA